ncbi:MAG: 2OG-Fe(II) oxygenase [Polyangiales bacterium]
MSPPDALDLARWEPLAATHRAAWDAAAPFSHLVLEDFLPPAACAALRAEFDAPGDDRWIENRHVSQRLRSRNGYDRLGPPARAILDALDSSRCRAWVSAVTGVPGLFLDRDMVDGGLAVMGRGDYFDLHTDMQAHALRRRWRRRVNLIVYLSDPWDDAWGGALELWRADGRRCVTSVAPRHNRAVLFEVSPRALHGVPEPLRCPPGARRRNLVLYYFTEERDPVALTHFRYRARPGELARRPWVFANNAALAAYQLARARLGDLDLRVSRCRR